MNDKKMVIFALVFLLLLAGILPIPLMGHAELDQAEAAWAQNDFKTATESYARAAQRLPWRGDLWEKAGIAAAADKNPATAIGYLERASNLTSQGWVSLGFSYYEIGDYSSAIASYQEGLQYHDSHALYAGLRLVHYTLKDWPAERTALENQVRLEAKDAFAHYRLGLLLSILEPEKALPELMTASSLEPQYDPAVQSLRAALQMSSQLADPSGQMVRVGRGLGLVDEWDLALEAFRVAVEKDEANAEGWAWLGEAKQQIGRDGRPDLDHALSLNGTSVTVRALRGLYWDRQGKYPQMLAEYLLASGYEPQNPAWQVSLGDAYLKLGDLASAFNAYQRAAELAPNESTYWRLLAGFCAENGVQVEQVGLPAAQKAVELAPTDPLALDVLGYAYFSSGRFANAEQILKEVIQLAPGYFPAHIHLALNYLGQGNLTAAYASLAYVRDENAGGPDAVYAQKLLDLYFP